MLARMQKYHFVPRLYGVAPPPRPLAMATTPVLALQLMGPNLTQIRKAQPGRAFTLPTALHVALQMLTCLEGVHRE